MAVPEGRAAVVTGGSRGIGRAIVERLARDGVDVVFSYARDAAAAADVERTVKEAGGSARAVQADLTEPGAAERLMETAGELLGGLDILVNNASPFLAPTPLAETTEEHYDHAMAVNAKSVFLTIRHAARHMRDGGRIVNISTVNTARAAHGSASYVASKGALEQLTAVAARELGVRGITANTVSPGATDTELLHATNPAQMLDQLVAMTPLGRLGAPADVADVVAFLVSEDGRWLTGQNIKADGGLL
ncbi:SDR family oxidoreductase [Streptosporangium sp. NPDC023615]|uniref:SDR family oxidoreductase n=1 Tax=Streptosporangium sp. NPDC023615 TaxID=3154794 RepID=UPI0034391658